MKLNPHMTNTDVLCILSNRWKWSYGKINMDFIFYLITVMLLINSNMRFKINGVEFIFLLCILLLQEIFRRIEESFK